MSAQHTPVSWFVDDVEGHLAIAAESDGEVLAYLAQSHQQTNVRSDEEMAGIARLMAVAPEMLAELRRARDREYNSFEPDNQSDRYKRIVALIAKATGSAT